MFMVDTQAMTLMHMDIKRRPKAIRKRKSNFFNKEYCLIFFRKRDNSSSQGSEVTEKLINPL